MLPLPLPQSLVDAPCYHLQEDAAGAARDGECAFEAYCSEVEGTAAWGGQVELQVGLQRGCTRLGVWGMGCGVQAGKWLHRWAAWAVGVRQVGGGPELPGPGRWSCRCTAMPMWGSCMCGGAQRCKGLGGAGKPAGCSACRSCVARQARFAAPASLNAWHVAPPARVRPPPCSAGAGASPAVAHCGVCGWAAGGGDGRRVQR